VIEHGGNIPGFSASLSLIPSEKSAVVLLANSNNVNLFLTAARSELINRLLGRESDRDYAEYGDLQAGFDAEALKANLAAAKTYQPAEGELAAFVGDYTSPNGVIKIALNADKTSLIVTQPVGDGITIDVPIVPFAAGKFLTNDPLLAGIVIAFEATAEGAMQIIQDGTAVARRNVEGTTGITVADPTGRYTLTIPSQFLSQFIGNLVVFVSPNPQVVYAVEALPTEGDDIVANVERWNKIYDPNFNEKPLSQDTLTLADGTVWNVVRYPAPSGQEGVVYARIVDNVLYGFSQVGTPDALATLNDITLEVLASFTLTNK
jgi:hypothetical protein